jgi:hypothetical protein
MSTRKTMRKRPVAKKKSAARKAVPVARKSAVPARKAAPARKTVAPARRPPARTPEVLEVPAAAGRVMVENVNVPGYTHAVDAARYNAMKTALLKVLPRRVPGLTQAEMVQSVTTHLPEELFPGGAKAMWWVKCVQLDLEAKGLMARNALSGPLRWIRAR